MENTTQKKTREMTPQEVYQVAKRNEILNQLKKERQAQAAQEAFDHFADVMHCWTGNKAAPSFEDDEPLTETITLPDAYREPAKRSPFAIDTASTLRGRAY